MSTQENKYINNNIENNNDEEESRGTKVTKYIK